MSDLGPYEYAIGRIAELHGAMRLEILARQKAEDVRQELDGLWLLLTPEQKASASKYSAMLYEVDPLPEDPG